MPLSLLSVFWLLASLPGIECFRFSRPVVLVSSEASPFSLTPGPKTTTPYQTNGLTRNSNKNPSTLSAWKFGRSSRTDTDAGNGDAAASSSASSSSSSSASISDVTTLLEQGILLEKKKAVANGAFVPALFPGKLASVADTSLEGEVLPEAPQLSFDKFLTMQDKRVVATVRYSGESGLRPFFLTVAKKIKDVHPDIIIERRILPRTGVDEDGNSVFEILVDGKVVIGKKNRVDRTRSSVFVSMQELDVAVNRARRRRRPSTTYGGGGGDGKRATAQ